MTPSALGAPGAVLLSRAALASALLVVWNDLWLKRHHPGLISGKLSDVGLLVFLPLFIVAALEWTAAARRLVTRSRAPIASRHLDVTACVVAAAYFIAIKVLPAATSAHVEWLSFVMPRWHFRAVTDPTDLLCLPALWIAWSTMKRRRSRDLRPESSRLCSAQGG